MKKMDYTSLVPLPFAMFSGLVMSTSFTPFRLALKPIVEFGNHTGIDYSFLLVLLKKCCVKFRNDCAFIVRILQYAFFSKQ
jgi:hypothetical protein